MSDLPPGARPYDRTPSFTAATIPDGLRAEHATKPGVWAVIHVETGTLEFEDMATGASLRLDTGARHVIAPTSPHRVAPIGEVRFYVEFWR